MSKQILLGGKYGSIIGNYAIVDDEDFERVNQYRWTAVKHTYKNGHIKYYAYNEKNNIAMHRLIMNCTDKSKDIDHKNHNGLDNTKSNLRICTRSQNSANSRDKNRPVNGYEYRGIQKKPNGSHWRAFITFQLKRIYIGTYYTAEEAAEAYDRKAIELFGDFAYLNFPNKNYAILNPPNNIQKQIAKTGYKYININENLKKKYEVNIYDKKKRYRAYFYDIEDAINYKNKILKDIGRNE